MNNYTRGNMTGVNFRLAVLYGLILSLSLIISCIEAAPAVVAAAAAASAAAASASQDQMGINLLESPQHLVRNQRDAEISFGNSQNEARDKKTADGKAQPISTAAELAVKPAVSAATATEPAVAAAVKPAVADASLTTKAADSVQPIPIAAGAAAQATDAAAASQALPAAAANLNSAAANLAANSFGVSDGVDTKQMEESKNEVETPSKGQEENEENVDHVELREDDMGGVVQPELSADNGVTSGDVRSDDVRDELADVVKSGSDEESMEAEDLSREEEKNYTNASRDQEENHSTELHDEKSDDKQNKSEANEASADIEHKEEDDSDSLITKGNSPPLVGDNLGKSEMKPDRYRRSSSRSKRDLSFEDIRQIIDAGESYPERYSEEEDYNVPAYSTLDEGPEQMDFDPRDTMSEDGRWLGPALESISDDAFLLPSRKEEAVEKEIVRYEVLKRLLKEKEEEQAKEAVLNYLIAAAEDRLRDAVEEERDAEFVEKLEKIEAASENFRELPSSEYRVSKRFPYSYEPYGGPWGAVVPGAKRSSAGSDWYEPDSDDGGYNRLYRLAEALGDN